MNCKNCNTEVKAVGQNEAGEKRFYCPKCDCVFAATDLGFKVDDIDPLTSTRQKVDEIAARIERLEKRKSKLESRDAGDPPGDEQGGDEPDTDDPYDYD